MRIALALLLALAMFGGSPPAKYPNPDDLALSADGRRIYVTCGGTNELLAIDRASRSVCGRVPVGLVPRGVTVNSDGSRIYVANSCSDTVSEIDAATLKVIRTLPTGFEPTGVASDGASLFVANRLSND